MQPLTVASGISWQWYTFTPALLPVGRVKELA